MSKQLVKIIKGIPCLWCEEDKTYYPIMKKDEQTGLMYKLDPQTYTYLPCLTIDEDTRDVGIWGRRREKYLKEHKPTLYMEMFDNHTLTDYLIELNQQAEMMYDMITAEAEKELGVTEELKAQDQMEWVRRANQAQMIADEQVRTSLIYA